MRFSVVGCHDFHPQSAGLNFHQGGATRSGHCHSAIPHAEKEGKRKTHFLYILSEHFDNFSPPTNHKTTNEQNGNPPPSRPSMATVNSKVNISDEVTKSGVWIHVNKGRATHRRYYYLQLGNNTSLLMFF